MTCLICDLYAVIDHHLEDDLDVDGEIVGFAADLVTALPPRGHAFHNLATGRA